MKYRNILIALGFFIIITTTILGIPQGARDLLYVLSGTAIIGFGYFSAKEKSVKPEPKISINTQS